MFYILHNITYIAFSGFVGCTDECAVLFYSASSQILVVWRTVDYKQMLNFRFFSANHCTLQKKRKL